MKISGILRGRTLKRFMESEKSGGLTLIVCTLISILLANSGAIGDSYRGIWGYHLGSHTIADWINDGLMAVFFLLVGLELIQEIYEGELSNVKRAMLPLSAALGGMLIPALIYMYLNFGTDTHDGFGIPMATDIAFALGILSLLGSRVPTSLKVFLTALAVIDDLGAIIVIAIFYTTSLSWVYLLIALGMFVLLLILNKKFNVTNLIPYIIGGIIMWYCMLHSGIHATIAGVLLAITIPFKKGDPHCLSNKMQHALHYPVAFIILPVFALANTAMLIEGNWDQSIGEPFALGIILGLIVGKPLGITLFSLISVKTGLCSLPRGVKWKALIGAGMLGGIGFTMSIFITLLAYKGNPSFSPEEIEHLVNESKLMILLASLVSAIIGYTWLNYVLRKDKMDVKEL
ncbi:NhaA family Na+:H+ antiporter [Dysgonomonas sp. PFB1-18]|uniref:Na+/H+ antiporter NhaA n=1 Tax=unclassified Dysgonomonas TaxID=2630389 RepID=UPI0024768847|nr:MULTISPECIES: Na+/H+ antiporter NhaA [unclassified Dysgonomonas]MDH6307227.1 NhaA family Na+:H+ antiporter [Dysgonomonas sp. PF1-14]MDH6337145.1 NhaA family Na+:H+ antiporter [Dysgonomonas sp. PF1-16]MDH6381131.1 NhaA family Na+:H+ antiporter [Dysgonomonas sp. PFB1-18]MDH6396289.1 NhaA family Na+:H+ antiporter [Dysgonomonas sp. PF1-23]